MTPVIRALLAGLALLSGRQATAVAQRLVPPGSIRSGTLSFEGHGTLGDFVGTTDSVTGRMSGGQLPEVRGWVEAPVRTLLTGNDRRDRDLNKSMESDQFPKLRFDLDRVEVLGENGDLALVTLHGRMTLHGVERSVALPGTLQFAEDGIQVLSDFPLNLKDYDIGGLSKFLGLFKMDPDILVHVDLVFHSVTGSDPPGFARGGR